MHKRIASVGAIVASVVFVPCAVADIGVALEWTFNGSPGDKYDLAPGDSVTVGLVATWFDTEGMATAFGGLIGAEICITGDTGTSEFDSIRSIMRSGPFNFGPSDLDGLLSSNPNDFQISGVGPLQNQFGVYDTSNPTGVIWQFVFNAGPDFGRTVFLEVTGLENALLFTTPGNPAIIVRPEMVTTSIATINIPAPGAVWLIGAAGTVFGRRRRRS